MNLHLLFPFLFSLLFTAETHATSFYIRPFPDFTQSTAHIIRGTLSNIHTENALTADGGKTIYTYATVSIEENLKGSISGSSTQIRKVGGTKDGVTLEIPSSPEFTDGEETVLFLSEQKEDHTYEVTGLELGKFGLHEEGGNQVLTGGIFNYTNPKENSHGPWNLNQLKELIQQNPTGPAPSIPSTSPATAMSEAPQKMDSPPDSPTRPSQSGFNASSPSPITIEGNPHSVFFALAIGVLFLGIGFFLYRKRK